MNIPSARMGGSRPSLPTERKMQPTLVPGGHHSTSAHSTLTVEVPAGRVFGLLGRWCMAVMRSEAVPMKDTAAMIRNRAEGIVAWGVCAGPTGSSKRSTDRSGPPSAAPEVRQLWGHPHSHLPDRRPTRLLESTRTAGGPLVIPQRQKGARDRAVAIYKYTTCTLIRRSCSTSKLAFRKLGRLPRPMVL